MRSDTRLVARCCDTTSYSRFRFMGTKAGMQGRMRVIWLTALSLAVWSGCAMPHHVPRVEDAADARQSKDKAADAKAHGTAVAATDDVENQRRAGSNIAPRIADGTQQSLPSGDLASIMAELQSLGAIDPAMQNQLMEDLKQTDPALWPGLVQSFRATLAYQRRAAGLDVVTPASPAPANHLAMAGHDVPPPRILPAQNMTAAHPLEAPLPANSQVALAAPQPPVTSVDRLPATNPALLPVGAVDQASATAPVAEVSTAQVVPAVATVPVGKTETVQQAALVTPAAAEPAPLAVDWQGQLAAAIQSAESTRASTPDDEVRREAHLRLLYLVAGRREDAMRPIAGATTAEQSFWSQELFALATYLDRASTPDATARAAAALVPLNDAAAHLAEASPIAVRNLCFCTDVKSYGVYEKFATDEFQPTQTVVLYAEVENFKSEQTAQGFHTALKSRYLILDPQGQRVDEHEFPLTEEHCGNRRRDFFMTYYLKLPERIYDGQYTLQLTIEDTLGKKVGQSSTTFKVKAN